MKYLFIALLFVIGSYSVNAQTESDIVGDWYSPNKDAKIYMYKDKNGKYYGKISWLKDPNDKNNKLKLDTQNPDPNKRKNPILGHVLFKDFVYKPDDGEHIWEDGTVYDAESGKTYNCIITLKNSKLMEVRGYIGFSMFGRTESF